MVSVELARQLKGAGLTWSPGEHDSFVIPDTGLETKVFVISELTALVQQMAGVQHITFHGSSEWALDHVMIRDALWMPSETQLRRELEQRVPGEGFVLEHRPEGYRVLLLSSMGNGRFHPTAEDAYASALLHVLQHGTHERG